MNSAVSASKKSALCRYFATSGTCYYGADCQFLHEAPAAGAPRPRKNPLDFQSPENYMADGVSTGDNPDGANGDQYFSATFNNSNGLPDFQPFNARQKGARMVGQMGDGAAKGPFFPPNQHGPPSTSSMDDSVLTEQFGTMSMASHPQTKLQATKGKNPSASEFIPKASTPTHSIAAPFNTPAENSIGLSHSASSPSFQTYAGPMGPLNSTGLLGNSTPNSLSSTTVPFSTGISPMASPHLSPQGSPLSARRNKSPAPLTNPGSSSTPIASVGNLDVSHTENFGGTTYFYRQDDLTQMQNPGVVLPNFTMYPGILPHVAHMKPKSNQPSFFMADELKLELLNRHATSLAQIDGEAHPEIPQGVDNYHSLFPLEPPMNPMPKSCTFGYHTTVYKAICTKDGLTYCLRRIHGFRLVNTKCMAIIDLWKKLQHSNIIQLREVFTTKAFGDHSMVFVYDYHPRAETLMCRHFSLPNHTHMNGYNNPYNLDGAARPYSAGKGGGPRQTANLMSESVIWSYIVQLSSALRAIHALGLAARIMDPTKILLTDKSRIRLNCVGIFDVLSFDANQTNPLSMMPHYQQEDLVSLGKVVLALACNSIIGIQREHMQTSVDLVARNYSADLKNLILYLLTNQNRPRSVNDIMPMIGARFYTQLDAAQLRNDTLENELAKEVENGRLLRLLTKLGVINERPEFHMDPAWSETGDRYMLKLFRDYLFHQMDEHGAPWIDMGHVVQTLNKLDAGAPDKICLMSRDEQNVLVVSYADLKQCCESAFNELHQAGQPNHQYS